MLQVLQHLLRGAAALAVERSVDRKGLAPARDRTHPPCTERVLGGPTIMISALEIGVALSAPLLLLAYVVFQPKPNPVRIRARRAGSRHRPHA